MSHVPTSSAQHAGSHAFEALPHQPENLEGQYQNIDHYAAYDDVGNQEECPEAEESTAYADAWQGSPQVENGGHYPQYQPYTLGFQTSVHQYQPATRAYSEEWSQYSHPYHQKQTIPYRPKPNYKPSALKWPFLTTLLFSILALIGAMAYGYHTTSGQKIGKSITRRDKPQVLARHVVEVILPRGIIPPRAGITAAPDASGPWFPIIPRAPGPCEYANNTCSKFTISSSSPDFKQGPSSPTLPHGPGSSTISRPGSSTSPSGGNAGPDSSTPSPGGKSGPESSTANRGINGPSDTSRPGVGGDGRTETPTAATDKDGRPISPTNRPSLVPEPLITITLTNSLGVPTATFTSTPSVIFGLPVVITMTNSQGVPTGTVTTTPVLAYRPPVTIILTNSLGVPTATSVSIPRSVSTPTAVVLTNSLGQPTATMVSFNVVTPSLETLTDQDGVPTATITNYPVIPSEVGESGEGRQEHFRDIVYWSGIYLPTFVATLVSIPIRILALNAKIFQPWHELTHPAGAYGYESLCFWTSGWEGLITTIRSLLGGQPLTFLTFLLTICSALLIPLAAEAVGLNLSGSLCYPGSTVKGLNCSFDLGVFEKPAIATIALLSFMAVLVLFILILLRKWQSGVNTNPWSFAGVTSLSTNPEVGALFQGLHGIPDGGDKAEKLLKSAFSDRRFKLGYFSGPNDTIEYGILLIDQHMDNYKFQAAAATPSTGHKSSISSGQTRNKRNLPFIMLGWIARIGFILVAAGISFIGVWYLNMWSDPGFERFMSSESFGVNFLFTSAGVFLTFTWGAFYNSVAIISPILLLSKNPMSAKRSILLSPPTNPFSGLISAIRRRHFYLCVVAATSIISEALPMFLANVRYSIVLTRRAHVVAVYTSAPILFVMIIVMIWSFFIKWPHMPVDPSTIAGAMYYVQDSSMLQNFTGLGALPRKERDIRVNQMGYTYEYGDMYGVSGAERIGVDITGGKTL